MDYIDNSRAGNFGYLIEGSE